MATAAQITSSPRLKMKRIAALTDFSKNADTALRFAATLARASKATLVLAHAYLPPSSAFAAPEMKLAFDALQHFRQRLSLSLLRETEASYLRDINCTTALHEGTPRELVQGLSDADLIVVSTSGETGFKKAALGSIAEGIFRSSRIPVLTVGPHCHCGGSEAFAPSTILYATDFSAGSVAALPYVLSIAGEEQKTKLALLHVAKQKNISFSFDRAMASAEPLEKLHELAPENLSSDFKPIYLVGFGVPNKVIVEEAKRYNADLIVIGAHSSGMFASAAAHCSGGTAYKVAANAECPVLTIHTD